MGWDASVLQNVWEALRIVNGDYQTKSSLMQDASVGVLKIHKLFEQMAGNRKADLQTRLDLAHMARWVGRTIPIDTREEYQRVSHSFAGIKDLLEADLYLIAAAANMPVTKFFGRSPAGQNSTGEHDEANWIAQVESARTDEYQEGIEKIVKIIAGSLGAVDLENWGIVWPPAEHFTTRQRAEIDKLTSETDLLRVNLGVDNYEMIRWRYGQGEYRSDQPFFQSEQIDEWEGEEMEALETAAVTPILPEDLDDDEESNPEVQTENEKQESDS